MPKDKKTKKDSTLLIKIARSEKDQFIEMCEQLDTSASREVRHMIRKWMKENS